MRCEQSFFQVSAVDVEYSASKFLCSVVEVTDDPLERCACDGIVVDKVAHLVLDVIVLFEDGPELLLVRSARRTCWVKSLKLEW